MTTFANVANPVGFSQGRSPVDDIPSIGGIETVLAALGESAKNTGKGWAVHCPAHDDRKASLSVNVGDDGKVLLKCHAGCEAAAIVAAAGLCMSDLFPAHTRKTGSAATKRRIVATYQYRDESGAVLFESVRYTPKDFRQRRPTVDGNGWTWNLKEVRLVPYRLPELISAVGDGQIIYIVEGEKDVETLRTWGLAATCNPMGAGKWEKVAAVASEVLRGARVVVIPDDDEPGRKHAAEVAVSLGQVATEVKVLPPFIGSKDVTGWKKSGGTREWLEQLVWKTTTTITTPAPAVESVQIYQGSSEEPHPWDQCGHTLEEFTQCPPPPTRLLIAGLLEASSLGIVSGRPGSLKTMLMLWLLIHIAAGRDVLGRRVEQANVIVIDVDNGKRRMHRRLYALARSLGITSAPMKTFVFPQCNLSSPESVDALESLIRQEKAGIVLIDTFVHASGVDDENDSAKLTEPLYGLRRIVDTTECAIMLVHHPSKAGSPLRGSSAIEGAVDIGLIVERPDKSKPLINISTFKTRDAVPEPFSLHWQADSDQMGELVGGTFAEVEKDEEHLNELHHRLVEELREGGHGGLNALVRRLKCNKNALATLLSRLARVHAVTVTPGPRKGKIYGLSSTQ